MEKSSTKANEDYLEDAGKHDYDGYDTAEMPESLRGYSAEELDKLTKKAAVKMDLVIMPCVIIMYIFNYLDRNNVSNAKLAGLVDDLNLTATQFQTSVSILFAGYILMQVPSNMVLSKIKHPGLYICSAMALWGVISACTGAVHNFGDIVAVRFLVGVAETVFFPGALYYLSMFYNRKQYALRAAFLYSGSQLGNAFGGLLAIAILKMDGLAGLQGWRWLFIIEGSATVLVALIIAIILPSSPATFKALAPTERDLVIWRYGQDQGQQDSTTELTAIHGLKLAVTDIKTWMLCGTLFGISTAASVTNFFPTVVATLGFSRTLTYVLTAPPYLVCVATMLLNGLHSDLRRERYWHIVCPLVLTMIANIIAVSTLNTAARYIAMMLMPTTFFPAYIVTLSWITGTISQPAVKRAVAIAIMTASVNTPNIWSSYLWFNGPRYTVAFLVNMAFAASAIGFATVTRFYLRRQNARLDRGEDLGKNGPTTQQQISGFRYML